MKRASRAEICILACAEAFRGDGEILASPMGPIPRAGARLARLTFEPDLCLSDGVATLVDADGHAEGRINYRRVFDIVWSGRRHVMMGASQIDRFGNQNIACIGEWRRPKAMLLGVRGAPGNTICHPTSYFVPRHSARVFVPAVDLVSGVGSDRAARLGPGGRFHEIRRVVTDLAVLDLGGPGGELRLVSVHPGVEEDTVAERTGFELHRTDPVTTTPAPGAEALRLIREVIDPDGAARATLADP